MVHTKPSISLENDAHELWNLDIQTDHIISARRPDFIIIDRKKRTCKIVDLVVSTDHRVKLKRSEKNDKYLDFTWEVKKMELENDGYVSYNCHPGYSHQRTYKRTGGLGNKKTSGDHPNYCIIEIGKNTEKSPGDLRRLAVSSVENHELKLKNTVKNVQNSF